MSRHFFSYDDGDFAFSISDNMAMNFDDNCKPDIISRITVDYHRLTKIKTKEVSELLFAIDFT